MPSPIASPASSVMRGIFRSSCSAFVFMRHNATAGCATLCGVCETLAVSCPLPSVPRSRPKRTETAEARAARGRAERSAQEKESAIGHRQSNRFAPRDQSCQLNGSDCYHKSSFPIQVDAGSKKCAAPRLTFPLVFLRVLNANLKPASAIQPANGSTFRKSFRCGGAATSHKERSAWAATSLPSRRW